MSTMTLTSNVLATLREQEDNSIELLVLNPPEDEIRSRTQMMEVFTEATRVVTETGSVVTSSELAEFLVELMFEQAATDEDDEFDLPLVEDEYIPYIDEILGIMGRGDIDPEDLFREGN